MSSIEEKVPIPPAVNSLLSTPSRIQSVLLGREPPTDSEKDPRAATSLLAADVKKLLGFVSAVAPGVREASWTKSRPFRGSCAACCALMTWPREGLEVSTVTADADTSTVEETVDGASVKFNSRASSTCRRTSLFSAL